MSATQSKETPSGEGAAKSTALRTIEQEEGTRPLIATALTALALLIAAAIAAFLILQFTQAERDRELRQWQTRLGIIADSRFADIQTFLDTQTAEMQALAANESMQLYMTLLYDPADAGGGVESAEVEYLANLLAVVADRAGFTADTRGPAVAANVRQTGLAGIAIVDADGRTVVTSPGTPPIEGAVRAFLETAPKGAPALSDIFVGADGNPAIAVSAPVFELQSDETAASHIATIVGIRPVADAIYPLLAQPGNVDETAEAVLLRLSGTTVEYLSPLADGTAPLKLKLAVDTPDLAGAWAARTPGGFAEKVDYAGEPVLVVARGFTDVGWTLLYKIDRAEALSESENRLQQLMIAFALITILVLLGGVALWYYGTSRRAKTNADRFEKLAARFEAQRDFMHLVTDNQPNAIAIFDKEGHLRWFNARISEIAGMSRKDLFGKHASAIFGPIEGKRMAGWAKDAVMDEAGASHTHDMEIGTDGKRIYRTDLIFLPGRDDLPAGALFVMQDISESVRERERREEVMRQLVNTLVSVVDQRDPFSANHSVRVGQVARAIAEEMELDHDAIETAGVAGSLMNLGKITVPSEILTKHDALTDAEFAMIRDSVLVSAKLVENVDFEGPVSETLAQMLENYDGSGMPKGLKADDIAITSRIVAAANAFVGMVSARAWRDGMPFDAAIDALLQEGNKKYDRRVVVALVNRVDNHGGAQEWAHFSERPAAPQEN